MIVSNVAGTTRDAVDTKVKFHGKEYIFIDTAGLRRKSKIKEELERFSIIRAVAAVEKADVDDRCDRGRDRAGCQDRRDRT